MALWALSARIRKHSKISRLPRSERSPPNVGRHSFKVDMLTLNHQITDNQPIKWEKKTITSLGWNWTHNVYASELAKWSQMHPMRQRSCATSEGPLALPKSAEGHLQWNNRAWLTAMMSEFNFLYFLDFRFRHLAYFSRNQMSMNVIHLNINSNYAFF